MWETTQYPKHLEAIIEDTHRLGFNMASEPKTGALLRVLAASKPGARILELGTGTGISAAWMLDGLDKTSTLTTVDNDPECQKIARKYFADDPRIHFICRDGEEYLASVQDRKFDLVFADAWAGKFSGLHLSLNVVAPGGYFVIDDLLPQPNWPEGHATRVPKLIHELEHDCRFNSVKMEWASGIMLLARIS
jgi:predicted O-methyltransferase YrrM